MEVALAMARWLIRRRWGKPFGWLIYAVCFCVGAVLVLASAALVLGAAGGLVYVLAKALLSSNPLSVSLFLAMVALAVGAVALWWSLDHEVAWLPVGAVAVAVGIAWLISIPGNPPAAGSRAAFCAKPTCVGDWQSAAGYRVRCSDGTWSFSGGIQGACSSHGGYGG